MRRSSAGAPSTCSFSNAGNAGVIAPLAEYPEDVFDDVWRVHVKGAFLACKYGIPRMQRRRQRHHHVERRRAARRSRRVRRTSPRSTRRSGSMRCAAKEAAARRIRVNTIHPGPTRNEFQTRIEGALGAVLGRDAGRILRRADSAAATRRAGGDRRAPCCSWHPEQSSFITGSTLVVDGGMSA